MALGGRPKEEGGHKPYKLSFDQVTSKGLEKIRDGGNISKFVEKQLKPAIKELDPGQASIHVWKYEVYLSQQIIRATQENKLGEVQALASIANAVKEFRDLCGIPPTNFNINPKPADKSSPMSEYDFLKWYIEHNQKMVKEALNKRRKDR